MPMHTSFFLVAMLMTVVALALAPLLRERLMVERRGEDGSGTLPHATRHTPHATSSHHLLTSISGCGPAHLYMQRQPEA
jgi:hypothetical protein